MLVVLDSLDVQYSAVQILQKLSIIGVRVLVAVFEEYLFGSSEKGMSLSIWILSQVIIPLNHESICPTVQGRWVYSEF